MGPPGGGVEAEHVYRMGMRPPSAKAGMVIFSGGTTFGRAGALVACCAASGNEQARTSRHNLAATP